MKIKHWFKDPYNLALIGILVFAFCLRLYYFILTKNQPLWWDEAEYLSIAKHWALGTPYSMIINRPPLFPLLESIFFLIRLPYWLAKLFFVVFADMGCVFLTYIIGKKLYNKKIGLLAAFLFSIFWSAIFWSMRYQPDALVLLFQLISIYFFMECFIYGKQKTSYGIASGLFLGLALLIKIQALLLVIIFGILLLIVKKFSFLKEKLFWTFSISFVIPIIPYLIWNFMKYKNPIIFASGYTGIQKAFGWYVIKFIYIFLTPNKLALPFFIFLIAGIVASYKLLLGLDIVIKKRNTIPSDLISIIVILITVSFFIFYIRDAEDRWLFLIAPFLFFFCSKGMIFLYDKAKQYKKLVIAILIILILMGTYGQLKQTDLLIKIKKDTYAQVRDAALWMKENSDKNDVIMSASVPQMTFYAERNVTTFAGMEEEEFTKFIEKNHPKYFVISRFEGHPEWSYTYPQRYPDKFNLAKVYYMGNQPILVVYEII